MSTTSSSIDSKRTGSNAPCPICGGVGFLRRDVPVDDPDFGKAIPCECKKAEVVQAELADLRTSSGLTHLSRMTFETFRPDGIGLNPGKRKNLHQAFDSAREFAHEASGWLILKGGYGCGKTHLAAAIANDRLARREPALFVLVPDLLDHLRATFAPTSLVSYDDRFEAIRSTPFLIMDDLGVQTATPWAQEKLFQLLNHRYNAQLPTVITTNRELEEIDLRLRSRLADSSLAKIVTILAPDFRQGGADMSGSGMSNLSLYGDMTFQSFDLGAEDTELSREARDNLRKIFTIAKHYAAEPHGFMVFTGVYGCGKTHLAAAIANEIARRGESVLFVVVPDLLDHLRATFAPGAVISYDRLFEEARTAPLLVLDDLGTESATPWAREKLFQIVDYRYVAHLPTVITFSRHRDSRDNEGRIDPRIQTRIFDLARSSVNEIIAPSHRKTDRRVQDKSASGQTRVKRARD